MDIEEFGKVKREWLSGFLDLSTDIPSHDTFSRTFAMLDSEGFVRFFSEWVVSVSELTTGQVIPIGKRAKEPLSATSGTPSKVPASMQQTQGLAAPRRGEQSNIP